MNLEGFRIRESIIKRCSTLLDILKIIYSKSLRSMRYLEGLERYVDVDKEEFFSKLYGIFILTWRVDYEQKTVIMVDSYETGGNYSIKDDALQTLMNLREDNVFEVLSSIFRCNFLFMEYDRIFPLILIMDHYCPILRLPQLFQKWTKTNREVTLAFFVQIIALVSMMEVPKIEKPTNFKFQLQKPPVEITEEERQEFRRETNEELETSCAICYNDHLKPEDFIILPCCKNRLCVPCHDRYFYKEKSQKCCYCKNDFKNAIKIDET